MERDYLVDLPSPEVSRLIRIYYRNGGRLSRRKRPQFPELTAGEIEACKEIVRAAFALESPAAPS